MFALYQITKKGNFWYVAFSSFIQTSLGQIYVICIYLVESVIPTILLILLSFIAKTKFNKRIRKNQETGLATNPNKLIKDEIQFSRMTMITMTLFCTVRLIDMAIGLVFRMNTVFDYFDCKIDAIIYLLRQLVFLLMLSSHAFNTLIYYAMNSKLKEILPKRSCCMFQKE
jgi:hypothetical protein